MYRLAALYFLIPEGERSAADYSATRTGRKRSSLHRARRFYAASLRSPRQEDFVDASVRQFCANANARLQACVDFDGEAQSLDMNAEVAPGRA
jgi:hypothetical protein